METVNPDDDAAKFRIESRTSSEVELMETLRRTEDGGQRTEVMKEGRKERSSFLILTSVLTLPSSVLSCLRVCNSNYLYYQIKYPKFHVPKRTRRECGLKQHTKPLPEMKSLYIAQPGCYISLKQEQLLVKRSKEIIQTIQLPHLEQIFIFSASQVTTQAIRACLTRQIPIVYLSRMGRCYGRLTPIESKFRGLLRSQHTLSPELRLATARSIVAAKIRNSRVLLQRQSRRLKLDLSETNQGLHYLEHRAQDATTTEQLMGFEGAAAAAYFGTLGQCITGPGFTFKKRSRRPPEDPVNAMLSFGYQVLWNHLHSLIEIAGLDPYEGVLHTGSDRHAALVSDLLEEFRAPIVDSLTLYAINRGIMDVNEDFDYPENACYLNTTGCRKFLGLLIRRMEEELDFDGTPQPRWAILNAQVRSFAKFITEPDRLYIPYSIR